MFIEALFTISKVWKHAKCPSTEEQIKRCGTYNGILLSHKNKRNEMLPFAATWIELENIMLSEINQKKTKTVYHLYLESKK